jgi:hypothetical protein
VFADGPLSACGCGDQPEFVVVRANHKDTESTKKAQRGQSPGGLKNIRRHTAEDKLLRFDTAVPVSYIADLATV